METSNFFKEISDIDLLIDGQPTPEALIFIKNFSFNSSKLHYFFSKLNSPEWILPLLDIGAFKIIAEEDGFKSWPQGNYLIRMVKFAPKNTAKIFKTVNLDEIRDYKSSFLECSLSFESQDLMSFYYRYEKLAVYRSAYSFDPDIDKVSQIALRICKEGNIDASIQLFKKLLRLEVKTTTINYDEKDHKYKDVISHVDSWKYREILSNELKELIKLAPIETFNLLLGLLKSAIELGEKGKNSIDYSKIWVKDIKEASIRNSHHIENALIAAINQACDELVLLGKSVEVVYNLLQSQKWIVFKRISFNFLSKHAEGSSHIAIDVVLNIENFSNYHIEKEVINLFWSTYQYLPDALRKKTVSQILSGPPLDEIYDDPNKPSEDEKKYSQLRTSNWIFERLVGVEDYLTDFQKEEFQRIKDAVNTFRKLNPSPPKGGWIGPNSSYSKDQLLLIGIDDLVSIIERESKIKKSLWESSHEGLARELGEAVKVKPAIATEMLPSFRKLPPDFISSVFSGLAYSKKKYDENEVFSFFEFIRSYTQEKNPDRNLRMSFLRFLEILLQSKDPCVYSTNNKKIIIILIRQFLSYANTSTDEKNKDIYTEAINSVRGVALHCLLEYSLGCFHFRESKKNDWFFPYDVAELLRQLVDYKKEKSLIIRSVFGRYLPWIILMDKNWVIEVNDLLFPKDPKDKDFLVAVLETYFLYCPVYDDVFSTVKESVYMEAITILINDPDLFSNEAKNNFGQHLVIEILRGKVKIQDELIQDFFSKIDIHTRKSALNYIGRSLYSPKEKVSVKILKRAMDLFNSRLQDGTAKDDFNELAEFGWFFCVNELDSAWKLNFLDQLVSSNVTVDPAKYIFEEMFRLLDSNINKVMNVSYKYILTLNKQNLYFERSAILKILSRAQENEDIEVRQCKQLIANYMGEKGFFEFKDFAN